MSDATITYLPRIDLPTMPGLYTLGAADTYGDLWMLTATGWWRGGRPIDAARVPAGLHRLGITHTEPVRPLTSVEEHLISRAVEAWAWRMRSEGREIDGTDTRDEAHGYYRQADQAQNVLNLLPWMRVTG